jgi:hypothetical protein
MITNIVTADKLRCKLIDEDVPIGCAVIMGAEVNGVLRIVFGCLLFHSKSNHAIKFCVTWLGHLAPNESRYKILCRVKDEWG